jgi:hypothetical protein
MKRPTNNQVAKRFGSDRDVERLTGRSRRTLQQDRFFDRNLFPYYKVGNKVFYDLNEVAEIILASRQGGMTA